MSDQVYEELVAAIRDLRILPGASLSETELAEQLQISRTPLREAIARLADNGLVFVVPQVGTRVSLISLPEVEEAWFVRSNLELASFAVACSKDGLDLEPLRQNLVEQRRCIAEDDLAGFFLGDEAFHGTIFALSGYPGVWNALQPLKIQLDRLRRLYARLNPFELVIDEHRLILDALERRDARAGQKVIKKHVGRVLNYGPELRASRPEFFTR